MFSAGGLTVTAALGTASIPSTGTRRDELPRRGEAGALRRPTRAACGTYRQDDRCISAMRLAITSMGRASTSALPEGCVRVGGDRRLQQVRADLSTGRLNNNWGGG